MTDKQSARRSGDLRKPGFSLRVAVVVGVVAALVAASATAQAAPTTETATPSRTSPLAWRPCPNAPDAECATMSLPVDWNRPAGPRFALALARRVATDPGARIGSLIFGPGGPGDSGVERVTKGMSRFSSELQRRFDIVSFDPRGVAGSNPVICSRALLAEQPAPVIAGAQEFRTTVAFNRRLRADCRARTGPLFDHLDTLSTVHDLDAIRAALGERTLTFHGSSYGTLLGQQYAETFPHRVRALVLESVVDHSLDTRDFLDTQAVTEQDSFDQFVAWCERTRSCALHGRDVRAVWAELRARADRGELTHPDRPGVVLTSFTLTVLAEKEFYEPNWGSLAQTLADLSATAAPTTTTADSRQSPESEPKTPVAESQTSTYPLLIFCQDWSLPVRTYREYAAHLDRVATLAPDLPRPRVLMVISLCLGTPEPVPNPQHRLRVRNTPKLLLTNAVHDPASGYNWALNVARQLGHRAVLLTYEGAGHGTYNSTPCARTAIDRYLISLVLPAPGTRCPAIDRP